MKKSIVRIATVFAVVSYLGRYQLANDSVRAAVSSSVVNKVESIDNNQEQVYIPDDNLREAIKLYVDFNNDNVITIEELSRLESLYAEGVMSLQGLEHAENLYSLQLNNSNLQTLNELKGLKNIYQLSIYDSTIHDISALGDLEKISRLSLSKCNIKDIDVLGNLKNLYILELSENNISDISSLTNLSSLEYLYLSHNDIKDIAPLANISSLQVLDLSNNPLTNLDNLKNFNIKYHLRLGLDNTNISDLNFLNDVNFSLVYLSLADNEISDLNALGKHKNLWGLNLDNNKITDITPLAELSNLSDVSLDNNMISDLSIFTLPLDNTRCRGCDGELIISAKNQRIQMETQFIANNSLKLKVPVSGISGISNMKFELSDNGVYSASKSELEWTNLNDLNEVKVNFDESISDIIGGYSVDIEFNGIIEIPIQEISSKKGWMLTENTWYYLKTDGTFATGWENINGVWYYFKSSGAMQTGWLLSGNVWYYLNESGAMVTGWEQIGGVWYYFDGSGVMQTGWLLLGSTWYYLNESGAMVTGWEQIGSVWYFFDGSGVMQTGWLLLGSTWYYLNESGAMVTGWEQIGGVWYYFYSNGVMATNTVIDGWQITDSGAAYLIQ